jgi:hypothetical protein
MPTLRHALPVLVGLTVACGQGNYAVRATVDAKVATRVAVRWDTKQPGTSWVEFGSDGLEETSTLPTERESESHAHTLLGLGPFQEVWYRAITVIDGKEYAKEGTIRTQGVPAELPEFEITIDEPELQDDAPYLLGTSFGVAPLLFAIDRQGGWRWYHQLDRGIVPVELEIERQGGGFVFNTFSDDYSEDNGRIRRLSFTGKQPWKIATSQAHHSFTQIPDGGLAWLALEVRDWTDPDDGSTIAVVGDVVVIRDAAGEEHEVFNCWDWLEPVKTDHWDDEFYGMGKDWVHANALRWDEERGTLLMSLRNLQSVVELELDTDSWQATPVRQYDGVEGSELVDEADIYRVADGSHTFDYLHNPVFTSDGGLMALVESGLETHVVEWAVDDGDRSLVETWTYGEGEALRSVFLGAATELPNGNRLLTFSSEGIIREVTPDGTIAWELQSSAGAVIGSSLQFSDFYAP